MTKVAPQKLTSPPLPSVGAFDAILVTDPVKGMKHEIFELWFMIRNLISPRFTP